MTAASRSGAARPTFEATLTRAAEALGLQLSAEQTAQLLDYIDLLDRWNRTYNLTAIRNPAEMLTQHIVDCLAAVPALRRTLPGPKRVLDVGSGGGLPGVVWAVAEPQLDMTCVDSRGKKAAFLQQVTLSLRLRNLRAEHARVEELAAPPFDVVASRAFAALSDFVEWTQKLGTPGAVWLAMKGKLPLDEMAALPAGFQTFHVERLAVPGLEAERCLIWIRRSNTHFVSSDSVRLQ